MTLRLASALGALLLAAAVVPAAADSFNRIATFHVVDNLPAGADAKKSTVAEIIAATPDGRTLVYTDSPGNRLGFVDLADASAPKAGGVVALGGEPTSVVVSGGKAMVGVVTSGDDFKNPNGHVAIIDIATRKIVATCELGGQPDSLALSPDGAFLAIAIENERDEKLNDGAIPQLPAGNLTIFSVKDNAADCATRRVVDLTGLAAIAPEDPEPEFVDINARNQAVVTLQENNHIVIVDLPTGKVVSHFSAGTETVKGVDVKRDGIISLDGEKKDVPREPDAVKWIDENRFVTADEGDWKGGTRGFTIFNRDGTVSHAEGTGFEYQAIRLGHYPEKRNSKGVEIEGAAVGTFGGEKLLFIGSERASLVGVYKDTGGKPELRQMLAGGVGPEGLLAIPSRNLFVTASEADNRKDGGIGSIVTVYQYSAAAPSYPTIASGDDAGGKPIPWGALSGLAADPRTPGKLFAVSDSFYAHGKIFVIDATKKPAAITQAITVTKDGKPAENLDLEGVAVASDGGFWLASEGNPEREKNKTQNLLIKTDAKGVIEKSIELPAALAEKASRFGFEGVTVTGSGADETVWIAVQREWKDDPAGQVRLLAYTPANGQWRHVRYPLDAKGDGWVGLSEITAVKGGFVILERDNQIGPKAKIKKLTRVSLEGVTPAALDAPAPLLAKTALRDLIPDLAAPKGYVIEKVEGFAIDAAGEAFIVTDNDGVDGSNGETQFIRLGKIVE